MKQAIADGPLAVTPAQKQLLTQQLAAVEGAATRIQEAEDTIKSGAAIRCTNRLVQSSADPNKASDFKNHRFLCDQWSPATGASVARAGQAADKLPEELKDIHGDGN